MIVVNNEAIEEAKNIPFDCLFEKLGIRYNPNSRNGLVDYFCPFHEHSTTSLHASKWNARSNKCMCYACAEGHDTISFVQKHERLSFQEAVIFLLEMAGIEDKYQKGKVKRKPYQIRYLSTKEKRCLGLETETPTFTLNLSGDIVPNGTIIGWSDKKTSSAFYDPDEEAYFVVKSSQQEWSDLMKDEVAYRTLILGKVCEAYERLRENGGGEEERAIIDKVAQDFGYFRVMKYIQTKKPS